MNSMEASGAFSDKPTAAKPAAVKNHDLKIWPEFFDAVANGSKSFELRNNDRRFEVGDQLTLREFEPTTNLYTGRECKKVVTYVLHGAIAPLKGLMHGFVILGLTAWGQK